MLPRREASPPALAAIRAGRPVAPRKRNTAAHLRRWSAVGILVSYGLLAGAPHAAEESPTPPAAETEPSPRATATQWPLFRGDPLSSGVAHCELPDKPSLLWKHKVKDGAFEATAAIVDNTVFVGDLDGVFYALDLNSGKRKWTFQTKEQDGFIASPAVYNQRVYIGDLFGRFYCLHAETGKKLWEYETKAEIDSSANFYRGNVLVGSQDATLYCLGAKTGKLIWKYTIEDQIRCTPTVVKTRCFVAGCDGKLHIIDLEKGASVANVDIGGPTMATPAVRGDLAYFGSEAGVFFCVNWKQASVVWRYEPKRGRGVRSSAAASGEIVVYGNQNRQVRGLDPASGKQLWTFTAKQRVDSSPVIVGRRAFVGSSDGRLYGLNLKSGKKEWEYEAGGGFAASPAVAAGKLVIATDDGVVYCFGKQP
ncbi:MAG: serine/threonine protein kinase [Planctomycetaceae bacterium]|nr:serine/threonine protein kinase [Planctomycetaceae bacterium]